MTANHRVAPGFQPLATTRTTKTNTNKTTANMWLISCGLVLVVAVASLAGEPQPVAGHGASMRLMLRLVDCLLDACDLQLERGQRVSANNRDQAGNQMDRLGGGPASGQELPNPRGHGGALASDSVNINNIINNNNNELAPDEPPSRDLSPSPRDDVLQLLLEQNEHDEANQKLIDYLVTTQPMDFQQEPQPGDQSLVEEGECWLEAAGWLRKELLAIRMRLLVSPESSPGKPPAACCVAETLVAFAQLELHLKDVCPSWIFGADESEGSGHQQAASKGPQRIISHDETGLKLNMELAQQHSEIVALNYVTESIEILAELAREALGRPWPSSGGPEAEREACTSIRQHQAFLVQLTGIYELVASVASLEEDGELEDEEEVVVPRENELAPGAGGAHGLMSEIFAPIGQQSARLRRQLLDRLQKRLVEQ